MAEDNLRTAAEALLPLVDELFLAGKERRESAISLVEFGAGINFLRRALAEAQPAGEVADVRAVIAPYVETDGEGDVDSEGLIRDIQAYGRIWERMGRRAGIEKAARVADRYEPEDRAYRSLGDKHEDEARLRAERRAAERILTGILALLTEPRDGA